MFPNDAPFPDDENVASMQDEATTTLRDSPVEVEGISEPEPQPMHEEENDSVVQVLNEQEHANATALDTRTRQPPSYLIHCSK